MNLEFVFKIIEKNEWKKAKKLGIYSGSTKDIEDGYIHFSEEQQVMETLSKYYKDKENLILLKVHTLNLQHLLWEQASNGDMYPHLYSPLDVKNVKWVMGYIVLAAIGNEHLLPIAKDTVEENIVKEKKEIDIRRLLDNAHDSCYCKVIADAETSNV